MVILRFIPLVVVRSGANVHGHQSHRTYGCAASAMDTVGFLVVLDVFLSQCQEAGGGLGDYTFDVIEGHPHHGATGDEALNAIFKATCKLDDVFNGRANTGQNIFWLVD